MHLKPNLDPWTLSYRVRWTASLPQLDTDFKDRQANRRSLPQTYIKRRNITKALLGTDRQSSSTPLMD